jgi:hypothetical protein
MIPSVPEFFGGSSAGASIEVLWARITRLRILRLYLYVMIVGWMELYEFSVAEKAFTRLDGS